MAVATSGGVHGAVRAFSRRRENGARDRRRPCPDFGRISDDLCLSRPENWKRTQVEVAGLMGLFRRTLPKETRALKAKGVRVRLSGDRVRLDAKLVKLMNVLEAETLKIHDPSGHCPELRGRDEVRRATQGVWRRMWVWPAAPDDVGRRTLPTLSGYPRLRTPTWLSAQWRARIL